MTTKQAALQPVNFLQLITVVSPFIIIISAWAISINVRVRALEIQFDNMNEKSGKMEKTLDDINKNLSSIALSINTLTTKFNYEKENNRKLENNGVRM